MWWILNLVIKTKIMNKYKIQITYLNESDIQPEVVELNTDNISWSMEQYQRNRNPFNWKVLNEKE
jgi:hypothetical protein